MMFSSERQPTKRRGRSRLVSQSEVSAAWDRVRDAAEQGSVTASALLIALAENKPLLAPEGVACLK